MAKRQLNPDEMFCTSCGEIIKRKAEICPECGVRHDEDPTATNGGGPASTARGTASTNQRATSTAGGNDVGLVMAFVDLWKAKKAVRHLLDLILIFVSFGTYLAIYFVEAFVHYYYLKKGKYGIYDEETDSEIWSPLLK